MDIVPDENGELPVLVIPPYEPCESYEVFYAVLDSMYSDTWTLPEAFKAKISFLTCVKLYLIGVHWDIERLCTWALDSMTAGTTGITKKPSRQHTAEERNTHKLSHDVVRSLARPGWHTSTTGTPSSGGTCTTAARRGDGAEAARVAQQLPASGSRASRDGRGFARGHRSRNDSRRSCHRNTTGRRAGTPSRTQQIDRNAANERRADAARRPPTQVENSESRKEKQ